MHLVIITSDDADQRRVPNARPQEELIHNNAKITTAAKQELYHYATCLDIKMAMMKAVFNRLFGTIIKLVSDVGFRVVS